MKKIANLLCVLFLLQACSKQEVTNDYFSQDLYQSMLDNNVFNSEMLSLDDDQIKAIYMHPDFDGIVKDAKVYISDDTNINEFAIIKGSNEVASLVDSRLKSLENEVKNYFPDQVKKIENSFIFNDGEYYIIIVSDNYDKAKTLFNDWLRAN